MEENLSAFALVQFYSDIGIDDIVGDVPQDRYKVTEIIVPIIAQAPAISTIPKEAPVFKDVDTTANPLGTIEAIEEAKAIAAKANTLDELKLAIESFKGLHIKRTATQLVFAEGNPKAKIMIIGDAPNSDDDRTGIPFSGANGQLLDKMMASIGLTREESLYITHIINWRPPANRVPSDSEIAISMPFIQKHISLVNPTLIILMGGIATKALMETTLGITRLRGKWVTVLGIPTIPMLHPTYLINSPQTKALAWADLLKIGAKIKELSL